MARQSEKHSLEEKQKKGRGTKRKQDWNGDEPVVKRRGFDTPSPISVSRPNSVTSSLLNDTNNVDVVNDDSDSNSTAGLLIVTDQNTSGRNTPDIIKAPAPPKMSATNSKSKTCTTATGKVVRPKKKGGSAAAAAGAMAGKLAASQVHLQLTVYLIIICCHLITLLLCHHLLQVATLLVTIHHRGPA